MRSRGPAGIAGAIALLPLVVGCYTYVPVLTPQPAPGTRLSLVLNDEGRLEAARQIGPYAMRVEGALVQSTDADYVLQVTDVVDIRGERNKWAGETLPLRRSYVAGTYERRLSRGRTFFLAGAFVSAFLAIAAGFDLLVFGGGSGGDGQPGPDPSDQ